MDESEGHYILSEPKPQEPGVDLVFSTERNRYECLCTYETKHIPKEARFWWDPTNRVWHTDKKGNASKLWEYADGDLREELRLVNKETFGSLEKSRADNSGFEPDKPEGMEFMPFQKAGIEWILSRNSTLLGDQMGLGKTVEIIGAVNCLPSVTHILVICPNSLKLNWKREIENWQTRNLPITVLSAEDKKDNRDIRVREGWTIINYDIMEKYAEIQKTQWDFLAIDECHYIKNKNAKRSILAKALGNKAKIKVAMTGTPIPNRPIELWNVLNLLNPKEWPSYWKFAKRYANAFHNGYGWDVRGASNLEELQEKLRSTVMIRRLKKDVMKDLPNKLRQIVEISSEGYETVINNESIIHQQQLEIDRLTTESDKNSADYEAVVERLKGLRRVMFEEMSRIRHETALAKVPEVIRYVKDVLENVDKVVVFAHHRDVLSQLEEELVEYGTVVIHGDTKTTDRQAAVDEFQINKSVRVFIGGIIPAGVGITLTASSTVVFAELDWVPGNITQAEDRCYRIGTTETVHVIHVVIDGSIDARLAKTLIEKQKVMDKALDNKPTEEKEEIKEPKKEVTPIVLGPLTAKEIGAIHSALKLLSSMCDGAWSKDGNGFNRQDTAFGKSTASQFALSQKQAMAAKKMLYKYHSQLPEELIKEIYSE